jgi:hypothetical protein
MATSSLPELHRVRNTQPELVTKLDTFCRSKSVPDPQVKEEFSHKKHNWYHPAARKHNDMLVFGQGPRCWQADIKYSQNHIGYGDPYSGDGRIDVGDVQITAISSDFPEWGSGIRTVPGPYGTQGLKGDRVPRYPKPIIENGTQRVIVPSYKQGANLSIVENWYDPDGPTTQRSAAGSSTKSEYGWKPEYYGEAGKESKFGQIQFRAGITQKSNMHGNGCLVKRNYIPSSNYVQSDPVIHTHA